MDRIADLDAASVEIEKRRARWLALGLEPGPTTWRESAGGWPQLITANRDDVADPDSVGVNVRAERRGEMDIVLFRGGWADLVLAVHDDARAPQLSSPRIASPEAFGATLDAATAELARRLG